jgi:hypothetical protein
MPRGAQIPLTTLLRLAALTRTQHHRTLPCLLHHCVQCCPNDWHLTHTLLAVGSVAQLFFHMEMSTGTQAAT